MAATPPGTGGDLRIFAAQRARLAAIFALMLAAALAEGAGLLLFVPMLAALGGAPVHSARLAHVYAWLGVPTALAPLLIVFVALAAVRAGLNYARQLTEFAFQCRAVDDLRARAWAGLVRCDWRTLSGMRRSDGASLLITEVELVGRGIEQLFVAASALTTLTGLGLAALLIAPGIALGGVAAGALALLGYRRMQRRTAQLGERLGAAMRTVHEEFDEGLGALRVIKSFGAEGRAIAGGADTVGAMRRVQREFYQTVGVGGAAIQAGGAAVLALLVWTAVTRWGAGAELILPVVAVSLRALPLLPVLHHCWQGWLYARPAIERSAALIALTEAAREPGPDDIAAPAVAREIALRGVTVRFASRERAALDAVDLVLPARGVTALLGPSGAGKSTIADVLGGLLTPDRGTLEIDGAALEGAARLGWRRQVTYVQQDPWLFPGTIRANLLWADPAADAARLHGALRLAAAEFVEALPEGLDTRIGDNGRALSGGERQRIVLARALLREPQLLILDEATSALDSDNEAAIARAVGALRTRMAVLVIGHRGRLAELADRTVRIERGRIVAEGAKIRTE